MSKLIELVESCINDCLRGSVFFSEDDARMSKALIDSTLSELRTRLEALERIEAAARVYATRYVQDEADDPEVCVCPGQHKHAKELIEALSVIEPIRGSWHLDAAMEAADGNA